MSHEPRRLIAGLDTQGKSCAVRDEPIPLSDTGMGMQIATLFTGPAARIDNAAPPGESFPAFDFERQLCGETYSMMIAVNPPGLGKDDPGMHRTDTCDHFYVISGEVVLVLEDGDHVMRAGDVGVIRGVMHGWRNDTGNEARLVTFVLPA
ncbi:MAG: cupin domain-containing protein [Sphingomonadaceae bacterium]